MHPRWLLAALAFLTAVCAHAQTAWSTVSSGTTHTLWSVCFCGGQFVAVGESGTILTSPDGLTWTPRTSGTDVWLTSVTYGLGNFIAVGDRGTVLVSHDGETWYPPITDSTRTSTERLNVVSYIAARTNFVTYGEHNAAAQIDLPARVDWALPSNNLTATSGWWRAFASALEHNVVGGELGLAVYNLSDPFLVEPQPITVPAGFRNVTGIVFQRGTFTAVGGGGAIVSSADGLRWSQQTSPTTEPLNGLGKFNNTLVAVGSNGTILSQDELGVWQRRPSPSTEQLLGVAGSDSAAVIVGGTGTILRATPAALAPVIVAPPLSVTETLGGAAAFVVRANGSLPLSYQWYRNGIALAGETGASLIRTPLVATDAGAYTVTVRNPAGSATSSVATLGLLPAPAAIVDETFHADAAVTGEPTNLLPLADGSMLIGFVVRDDTHAWRNLVKLRADGSRDPAWTTVTLDISASPYSALIGGLAIQPDGRVLVGGYFDHVNGQAQNNLVRLNRDGSLDSSFTPDPTTITGSVGAIAIQPDGKILFGHGPAPVRLLADGQIDSSFQPVPLETTYTSWGHMPREWSVGRVDVLPNGALLVGAGANVTFTNDLPLSRSTILRLRSDGSVDNTFARFTWEDRITFRVLDDGGVLVVGDIHPNLIGPYPATGARVQRLRADGTAASNYPGPTITPPLTTYIEPDGSLLYTTWTAVGPLRLSPNGAADPTFTAGVGRPSLLVRTADGHLLVAGEFSVYNAKPANRISRLNAVANGAVNAPQIFDLAADKARVALGETITVRAAVTGSADLTYEWSGALGIYPNNIVRTASPVLTFSFASPTAQEHTLRLTVYNPRGQATTAPLAFDVEPAPPVVSGATPRVSAQSGRDLTLTVNVNQSAGQLEYRWERNGQNVPQAEGSLNGPSLYLPHVTAANAGTYVLYVRNILGNTASSSPIVVTIDDSSRFANLSTRAFVGPGEQTMIAGFTVTGVSPRTLLIRGVGPGLARFGVSTPLTNPRITLYSGTTATNYWSEDWNANGNENIDPIFAKVGAFPLDPTSKDAVIIPTLAPGSYTVQLEAKPGQSGTALIEIYEDDNNAARIVNLSTRAMVKPGAPAICGFSIQGPVAKRVLLRAAGPALGAFGITGALANPRLTLTDATGAVVARNDDWETSANAMEIGAATSASGAFPFATGAKDAAVVATLPPGNYTMLVEGAAATDQGVVLLETYELP